MNNVLFGKVTEVDAAKGLARVQFEQYDGFVTDWLQVSTTITLGDQTQFPLKVNQKVWCLMDERREDGVIGGAIYDATNLPAGGSPNKVRTCFDDGLTLEYDRTTKLLKISGSGAVKIEVDGNVDIDCAAASLTASGDVSVACDGATIDAAGAVAVTAASPVTLQAPMVTVQGPLTVSGALVAATIATSGTGTITSAGNISTTGTITGGEVKEGSIRLGTHKHSGVSTGSGTSGGPTP